MTKLNKREKILLYIMVVVTLLAGGISFLIMPKMEALDALDFSIQEKQTQKDTVEQQIMSSEIVAQSLKELQKELDVEKENFLTPMMNDQLNLYLNDIFRKQGLSSKSMSIVQLEDAAGNGSQSSSDGAEGAQAFVEQEQYADILLVRTELIGEMSVFTSAIQELSENPAIHLVDFQLNRQSGTETASEVFSISLSFQVCLLRTG